MRTALILALVAFTVNAQPREPEPQRYVRKCTQTMYLLPMVIGKTIINMPHYRTDCRDDPNPEWDAWRRREDERQLRERLNAIKNTD